MLSRLPTTCSESDDPSEDVEIDALFVKQLENLPVSAETIQRETRKDTLLSTVCDYVDRGLPEQSDSKELDPYFARLTELTVQQNCLVWGIRVVVPPTLRSKLLDELHQGHVGVVKMKTLARSYMWWPGIDQDIEQYCKGYAGYQSVKHAQPSAPIHPWECPSKPWERIHIDFAGPFMNSMWLVVVDANSKWPEVVPMKTTTAETTLNVLRTIFARFGLPSQIVSDNGPQFIAEEFKSFCRANGIQQNTSAP